ncbi:MAG: M1 family metallopeptidase [Pseudomonadota bacterium]
MTTIAILRLAGALLLAGAAGAASAEAPFSFATTPGKLPKDIIPLQYAAHLVPDLALHTFLGSETVELEVRAPTARIVLNAAELDIDAASLSGKGWSETALTPVFERARQTVSFTLARPLAPGRYSLALKFHGRISREPRGLYYVDYQADGVSKTMLSTEMEPSDARRLLPCWDEPAFRARFKLVVDLPGSFHAYSNTPVEKTEALEKGWQRVSFGLTPLMPSYLMVLVAGELERSSVKQDGVDIGLVTTAGKQGSAAYTLGAAKDLLHYYNNYFGLAYPLPKLDHIAVPGGFGGAMENWGGIVYSEGTILVDPKKSPERVRQRAFQITAHETAHQWFGNLVTNAWWDNLWLNEGFASWMASKATHHFNPEWRTWMHGAGSREAVLALDARKTSHAIQSPVASEEQAADAFDAITYGKGQAFLQMLEAYLGEDSFRKGVRAYLARHQYSNATSADLWAALEAASGKPVARIASDWTTQPGYPVLKVEQVCENGKRRVTLTQEQFRLDEPATEGRLWSVPVQVGVVNGKAYYSLLEGARTTVLQPNCEGALVVDPWSVGYFRVQYDRASFDALASQAGKLPDPTRLKLLGDAWAMVAADRMELAAYLRLADKFSQEPRMAVWDTLLSSLLNLDALAAGQDERALVRNYIVKLVTPKLAQLGWDEKAGDTVEERQLRSDLASALARVGDPAAIAQGRARFARMLADPAAVTPASLDFTMYVAGRYADAPTYQALLGLLQKAQSTEERERYGRALAQALDPALAAHTLGAALQPDLAPMVANAIVPSVARSEHIDQAWAFAVANRAALMKNQDALGVNHVFPSIVSSSTELRHAELLEAYVKENFGADAQAEAHSVAAGIRIRAKQKASLLPQLRAALATPAPSAP